MVGWWAVERRIGMTGELSELLHAGKLQVRHTQSANRSSPCRNVLYTVLSISSVQFYTPCPLAHPRPSTPARGVSAADLFPVTLASPNSQRRKSLPPLLPPSSLAIGNILATSTHRRLSQAALQHIPSVLRSHGPRQLVRLSQHHPPPLRLPPPPLTPWLKDPAPRMAQCLAASAAPCPPSLTSSAA